MPRPGEKKTWHCGNFLGPRIRLGKIERNPSRDGFGSGKLEI